MCKKHAGLSLILLGMLAVSCVPVRKVAYVQDDRTMVQQQQENVYFIDETSDNTIRPGDELFIEVASSDEGPTNFGDKSQGMVRDASVISYSVDENGFIKLPLINRIKVSGLTLFEASDLIEKELAQFLYTPSVFLRFVNNKVTILGEVDRPGVYVFNYKSVNILQAIGYAGDISTFGNRQNVLIVREEGDYRSKYTVDLTSDELLVSPMYMVKSNDIIYVEPLRSKKWGMDTFPYNLLFSGASMAIVVLTFLANYYY
jgi:polysaccharide biosynthesis/export protein